MKARLFFTFLMVVFLLLALSVGAVQINKDTTVELKGTFVDSDGNSVSTVKLYDSDGDALIWYLDTNGALVSDKAANLVTVNEEGVVSFKDVSIFYSNNTSKSIVAVNLRDNVKVSGTEIDFDGSIFHFDNDKGNGDSTGFVTTGFQFGTYGHKGSVLEYFYFPITAQSITKRMFQSTTVQVVDILPGTPISKIGILAFYSAKNLKSILIPNDVEVLTSVQGQGLFGYCSSLEEVVFEENSILWNGGYNTFHDCTSLKKLYLPNSVKTFASEFVRGCTNLEEFSFGAGFEYFTMRSSADPDNSHMWAFYACNKLKKVYMPATIKILSDEFAFDDLTAKDERLDTFDRLFNNAGSFTLYFTGTESEMVALKTRFAASEENQSLMNAFKNVYSYYEFSALENAGSCAVYDYPLCDAFYDGEHILSTKLVYESFGEDGYKEIGCTRQGCCSKERSLIPAFFTEMGVSVAEFVDGAITVGYIVNYEAISEYEAYGTKISFGVFAVSQNKLGYNDVFDENGNMCQGAVGADLTKHGRAAFELKLVGFDNDEKKATLIAMGVYVLETTNGASKYTYVQKGAPSSGEKYYFTSYNNEAKK